MAYYHPTQNPDAPGFLLEIAPEAGESPIQIPVTIKTLSPGLVTLEAEHVRHRGWEDWEGRDCHLHLTFPETETTYHIPGIVSWARYTGDFRRPLTLGLELAKADLMTHKLLEDCLPHTPKDVKGLWDRWDQARDSKPHSLVNPKVFSVGLALLLGGLVLQMTEPRSLRLFGWLLWFLGSLGILGKTLWDLWQRRASR